MLIRKNLKIEENRPLRVCVDAWPGYAYVFIAKQKGFFEKNGADVEILFQNDVTETKRLYKENIVDGLFSVYFDIIMLNMVDIPTKVVYLVNKSTSGDVIIGKPDTITLRDLRNQRVSYEGLNSYSHFFVLSALNHVGIDESEVVLHDILTSEVLSALDEGVIDAGHTWEPVKSQALKSGYKVLISAEETANFIVDTLAFSPKACNERGEDITRIITSLENARSYLYENFEESVGIMASATNIDREALIKGIEGLHHFDLQENFLLLNDKTSNGSIYKAGEKMANFYLNRGQQLRDVNICDVIHPGFINTINRK